MSDGAELLERVARPGPVVRADIRRACQWARTAKWTRQKHRRWPIRGTEYVFTNAEQSTTVSVLTEDEDTTAASVIVDKGEPGSIRMRRGKQIADARVDSLRLLLDLLALFGVAEVPGREQVEA